MIGYSVSQSIDSELVKRAMTNAIAHGGGLNGAIFHRDRGSQYSSETFRRLMEGNRIQQSMSRGGCPYDNACSESFFATIKKERINCVLEVMQLDSIDENNPVDHPLHEILETLTEDAIARGVYEDNQVARDLFDTRLMGVY